MSPSSFRGVCVYNKGGGGLVKNDGRGNQRTCHLSLHYQKLGNSAGTPKRKTDTNKGATQLYHGRGRETRHIYRLASRETVRLYYSMLASCVLRSKIAIIHSRVLNFSIRIFSVTRNSQQFSQISPIFLETY